MRHAPEIVVSSSSDGLGLVLAIANPTPVPITVIDSYPKADVRLSGDGLRRPMEYRGEFAYRPHWIINLAPGEVCWRIVVLPPYIVSACGEFEVECDVPFEVDGRRDRLTVRGRVGLNLPTGDEYYSTAGEAVRRQVARYHRAGGVYPLPADA
jgi:hypothetical protein